MQFTFMENKLKKNYFAFFKKKITSYFHFLYSCFLTVFFCIRLHIKYSYLIQIIFYQIYLTYWLAHSAETVEYADCISAVR